MLSYCLKCKENTESINPKVSKTTNGKTMILSKCAICGSKKSKFRRHFVLIKYKFISVILLYKMNNIINKFLLAGGKFMPEMHLRQPQFTYITCGPFTKHKQRIQKKLEIQTISTKMN